MNSFSKLYLGAVFGRCELLAPIAQGGMASVWAARQKGSRGFHKMVAVKTLLPSLSDHEQFEQMFLNEASMAARIHHPNVAQIIDLGEQDNVLFLVMEWVDGDALSLLAKQAKKTSTPFPMHLVIRIIMQAAKGLHAAHELKDDNDQLLGLVHRDVSPQNILIAYDGTVKLVDFGVAKATKQHSGTTGTGQLKGKVPYMSPEQARGDEVDRRSDIFSLGIVLYRLTVGAHPFRGESDLQTMKFIESRPALPPRLKLKSYPPELEHIVMKCLQKDPSKRYQTMLELHNALEAYLIGCNVSTHDEELGAFVTTLLEPFRTERKNILQKAIQTADDLRASQPEAAPSLPSIDVKKRSVPPPLPTRTSRPTLPPPLPVSVALTVTSTETTPITAVSTPAVTLQNTSAETSEKEQPAQELTTQPLVTNLLQTTSEVPLFSAPDTASPKMIIDTPESDTPSDPGIETPIHAVMSLSGAPVEITVSKPKASAIRKPIALVAIASAIVLAWIALRPSKPSTRSVAQHMELKSETVTSAIEQEKARIVEPAKEITTPTPETTSSTTPPQPEASSTPAAAPAPSLTAPSTTATVASTVASSKAPTSAKPSHVSSKPKQDPASVSSATTAASYVPTIKNPGF